MYSMVRSVIITVGLQNDYINTSDTSVSNKVSISHEETLRIIGGNFIDGPIGRVLKWVHEQPDEKLAIVHIREWYDNLESVSLDIQHCIADTQGSEFIFKDIEGERNTHIINSTGFNSFLGTHLEKVLSSIEGEKINVGIIGLKTDAQVYFLAYELQTRYENMRVYICSALTASDTKTHQLIALDQLQRILGVEIIHPIPDFINFLIPDAGGEFQDYELDDKIIEQDEEIRKLEIRASHRLLHTQTVLDDAISIMDNLTEIALKDDDYTEDETYLLNVISEKIMSYKDFIKKILSDDIVSQDEHIKMKEYEKEILDLALSTANRDSEITMDEKNILNGLQSIFDNFHNLEPLE